MLTTITGITGTLISFIVTGVMVVVSYALALAPQVWNLAVQTYHAVKGMLPA